MRKLIEISRNLIVSRAQRELIAACEFEMCALLQTYIDFDDCHVWDAIKTTTTSMRGLYNYVCSQFICRKLGGGGGEPAHHISSDISIDCIYILRPCVEMCVRDMRDWTLQGRIYKLKMQFNLIWFDIFSVCIMMWLLL